MFQMCFAPSKCTLLLQNPKGSNPNLVLANEKLDELDRFSYLSSYLSPSGRMSDEATSRMQKAFNNMGYL